MRAKLWDVFIVWNVFWLGASLIFIIFDIFDRLDVPYHTEVCTRSHIKMVPITGLDGKVTKVPAERCDHYKIVEETN